MSRALMMIAVGSFAARTQAPHLAFLEPSVDRVSHTAWRWHRRRYGCDRSVRRVGNVATAFPLLEDPRQTAIKAVVIYCGTASIETFRRDLPVLYVRAGLDRPNVNEEILTPASRANSQKADVTVLNHATGYHGFELFNDDDATHDVIARTLMFLIHATRLGSRAALVGGLPEAAAAGSMRTGAYHDAVSLYAEMVRLRPDDARLRLSYGEALLGDRQFAIACTLFDSLTSSNLGPRDLGVPAPHACA